MPIHKITTLRSLARVAPNDISCLFTLYDTDVLEKSLTDPSTRYFGNSQGYARFIRATDNHSSYWVIDKVRITALRKYYADQPRTHLQKREFWIHYFDVRREFVDSAAERAGKERTVLRVLIDMERSLYESLFVDPKVEKRGRLVLSLKSKAPICKQPFDKRCGYFQLYPRV